MIATVIECDHCGKQLRLYGANGIVYATRKSRECGWSIGKRHLCNDCRKRKVVCSQHTEENKND